MDNEKYISFQKSTKSYRIRLPQNVAKEHGIPRFIAKRAKLEDAIKVRDERFKELGIGHLITEHEQAKNEPPTINVDGDTAIATAKDRRVKTVDDLLKHCEVDTDVWEVERETINSWDVTNKHGTRYQNFQVKAWLKRRFCEVDFDHLAKVLKEKKIAKITNTKAPKVKKTGNMLEVNIFDVHMGKLCWKPEVGENYDLDIACKKFMDALNGLLSLSSAWQFEKVLFPIGSDFFNIDNLNDTTTRGTPQQMEGRYPKMVATGVALIIEAIDKLKKIAPVEVVNIPGNHDEASDYWLAHLLTYRYGNDKAVTVDDRPLRRKYLEFYDCMIALAHGDGVKKAEWPKVAAAEASEIWGRTRFREYHLGHTHHEHVQEHAGLTVRWLGSISPADKWHFTNGYVGNRQSASAFVWTKGQGVSANLTCNL